MEQWYCSSYVGNDINGNEVHPDCDYYVADSDEKAIEIGKDLARKGVDYVDCGHVNLELLSVCKVDADNEFEETETIWF